MGNKKLFPTAPTHTRVDSSHQTCYAGAEHPQGGRDVTAAAHPENLSTVRKCFLFRRDVQNRLLPVLHQGRQPPSRPRGTSASDLRPSPGGFFHRRTSRKRAAPKGDSAATPAAEHQQHQQQQHQHQHQGHGQEARATDPP